MKPVFAITNFYLFHLTRCVSLLVWSKTAQLPSFHWLSHGHVKISVLWLVTPCFVYWAWSWLLEFTPLPVERSPYHTTYPELCNSIHRNLFDGFNFYIFWSFLEYPSVILLNADHCKIKVKKNSDCRTNWKKSGCKYISSNLPPPPLGRGGGGAKKILSPT